VKSWKSIIFLNKVKNQEEIDLKTVLCNSPVPNYLTGQNTLTLQDIEKSHLFTKFGKR
jgi:hypothetical protein